MDGYGWFIVVAVVAAAVLALLYFRFGLFRRQGDPRIGKTGLMAHGRVEVLESTSIDDERRLVLIRCDRIEHLIMVGGPADLVVENDVKKVRGPDDPKTVIPETGQHAAAGLLGGPANRPAATVRPAQPGPRPAQRVTIRPTQQPPAPPAPRPNEQRPRPATPQFGQSDGAAPPRRVIVQPAPLGGNQPAASGPAGGNGHREPNSPLPNAGVPWADSDSLENEIVQALRIDPVARSDNGAATPQPPLPQSNARETTLGDLADRLEEALAEEVQSARQVRRDVQAEDPAPAHNRSDHHTPRISDQRGSDQRGGDYRSGQRSGDRSEHGGDRGAERRAGSGNGAFAPSTHTASSEPRNRLSRQELPQTPEPKPSAPEPERRREQAGSNNRREEAPVISLNARRREAADPLEDEMARLLGELTGDTKGR